MSDIDVEFKYESLDDFKSSGYILPKEVQVIPVFHVRSNGDIFAVLVMNSTLCVKSLGMGYSRTKTVESFVSNSIRYNSLNSLPINDEYVRNHSHITFSTCYDVESAKTILNSNYSPIIFVDINVDNIEVLNNVIRTFRSTFSKVKSGVLTTDSDVTAMIYLSVEELFYLSRFTSYKITTSTEVIDVDIENQGFPARNDISEIYEANKSQGEIPMTDKYEALANCSPEIDFYVKRDTVLGMAVCAYLKAELPFMMK